MAIGNEPLDRRLEDGEFKSETRITYFPDPSVNMENLIDGRKRHAPAGLFLYSEPGWDGKSDTGIERCLL
jgi:hypothetical protein